MLLFYLFPLSAASKRLCLVAIAPPVPEMPSLPTNLPDFSPKEAGQLQSLPILQAGQPGATRPPASGRSFVAPVPSLLPPWSLFLAE